MSKCAFPVVCPNAPILTRLCRRSQVISTGVPRPSGKTAFRNSTDEQAIIHCGLPGANAKDSSLGNFNINQPQDRMPPAVVRAFGILKGAAATVNAKYGLGRQNPPLGKKRIKRK